MNTIKLSTIKTNPDNPRVMRDSQFAKLLESIKRDPQFLDKRGIVHADGVILGGNMRYRAIQEALKDANFRKQINVPSANEVPATWIVDATEWTEDQRKRFIILDNAPDGISGEWDWDLLANEWDAGLLEGMGLDVPVLVDAETETATDDEYEAPDQIKTNIVIGDLFEIGNHRLLCGDSTDKEHVAKLMDGKKADVVFTSPPYSDMRDYNGNKNLSVGHLSNFLCAWSDFADYQVVNLGIQTKNAEIVEYWQEYIKKAKQGGYKLLAWNVWDKMNGGSISSATLMFVLVHEWLFVFGKEKKKLNRTVPNREDHIKKQHGKPCGDRQRDGSIKKRVRNAYTHHQLHSCIRQTQEFRMTNHPAPFPVSLPAEHIKAMTDAQGVVADPFLGSGTTMVAAHQLNRRCCGMELDPQYCQLVIDRMRSLDQELKITKNGKPYDNG